MRIFFGFLLLVIGGLIGGNYYFTHDEKVSYSTLRVTKTTIVEYVSVTGKAEPTETAVVQAEVPGVVKEVLVETNDIVQKGQVLARLAADMQEKDLATAKAALKTAESGAEVLKAEKAAAEAGQKAAKADVDAAQMALDRVKRLAKDNIQQGINVELAEHTVKKAQAQLLKADSDFGKVIAHLPQTTQSAEYAKVKVELAQLALDKMELRAPITGVVLVKGVRRGDTLGRPNISLMEGPSLPFEIAAPLNKMRAVVKLGEADMSRVQVGQRATFTVDAYPDIVFEAKVAKIRKNPTPDRTAVSYPAELEFENRKYPKTNDWMVLPGMTVSADIEVGRAKDVVAVPSPAIQFTPQRILSQPPRTKENERIVWLLGPEGTPVAKVIQVGVTGIRTAIEEGAAKGHGSVTSESFAEVVGNGIRVGDQVIVAEPIREARKLSLPF